MPYYPPAGNAEKIVHIRWVITITFGQFHSMKVSLQMQLDMLRMSRNMFDSTTSITTETWLFCAYDGKKRILTINSVVLIMHSAPTEYQIFETFDWFVADESRQHRLSMWLSHPIVSYALCPRRPGKWSLILSVELFISTTNGLGIRNSTGRTGFEDSQGILPNAQDFGNCCENMLHLVMK